MKNKFANLVLKFGGIFAALALVITTITENSACVWYTYQEKMPENAKKLRKF